MAKKYIDAERLQKEVKRRERAANKSALGCAGSETRKFNEGKALAYQLVGILIVYLQYEQPCDTCTNDKGCVTCKDGELWEGKEQPCEELKEEIQRYLREECSSDDEPTIGEIARHFVNWQKSQMPMPEDTVIFQKGIEEGKRLMMEDAVEGYVNYYEDGGGKLMAEAQVGCPYHIGDKVKIIIVKED